MWPVMNEASSDNRKAKAAAISSTWARRPIGISRNRRARSSASGPSLGGRAVALRRRGVAGESVIWGTTQFTRIPWAATSIASEVVSAITAPFDTEYGTRSVLTTVYE